MSKKKKSGEKLRENHDWQVKIIISYKLVLAYIIKRTMKEFEDVINYSSMNKESMLLANLNIKDKKIKHVGIHYNLKHRK